MTRIAVDAMGGDFAPTPIVQGAVEAARQSPAIETLYLVGDQAVLERECEALDDVPDSVQIHHASEVVSMDESPAGAVRRKKDSSIGRAVDLVKEGAADAIFSAGNTGASVAATTLKLRTLEGVIRPAIATVFPTKKPFVMLDAGATPDASAEMLCHFAVMGSVYCQEVLEVSAPVVGLISIGEEDAKGNEKTKEAFHLLEKSGLPFAGNVESHDLFEGNVDVAVCDGFTGNVMLKTSEGLARAISSWVREEMTSRWNYKLGALLCRGAFSRIRNRVDPTAYGGAPLLGVNGVCVIGHGSSNARAANNAVHVASKFVEHQMNPHIIQLMDTVSKAIADA
jgi:glycerol-3-phosphate acyltransferase PlsX